MTNQLTAQAQTNIHHRCPQLCNAVATKNKNLRFTTIQHPAEGVGRIGCLWDLVALVVAGLAALPCCEDDHHMWGLGVLVAEVVLGVVLVLGLVGFWAVFGLVDTHMWGLRLFFWVFEVFLGFIACANMY